MGFPLARRLFFSVLLIFAAALAHAQDALPRELAEYAEAAGCQPEKDFDDRTGLVEPSYLYGYLPGWGMVPKKEREKTVVFWCKKKGEKAVYQLVVGLKKNTAKAFSLAESQMLSPCPTVVELPPAQGAPPGGLSLGRKVGMPLERFHYATLPGKFGPEDEFTDHQPLQSLYDGAGWYFYCYDGAWMVRGRN